MKGVRPLYFLFEQSVTTTSPLWATKLERVRRALQSMVPSWSMRLGGLLVFDWNRHMGRHLHYHALNPCPVLSDGSLKMATLIFMKKKLSTDKCNEH